MTCPECGCRWWPSTTATQHNAGESFGCNNSHGAYRLGGGFGACPLVRSMGNSIRHDREDIYETPEVPRPPPRRSSRTLETTPLRRPPPPPTVPRQPSSASAYSASSAINRTGFVLPAPNVGQQRRRIIGGYVLKCGKMLLGLHMRWIVVYDDATMTCCRSAKDEHTATKTYYLSGCAVEWGTLDDGQFALRIRMQSKGNARNKLTLVFPTENSLSRWVGALRCMFAATDKVLCVEGGRGGDTCAICLSDFNENQELSILPCEHRFCSECIDIWLHTSPTCPSCRSSTLVHGEPLVIKGAFSKRKRNSHTNEVRGNKSKMNV